MRHMDISRLCWIPVLLLAAAAAPVRGQEIAAGSVVLAVPASASSWLDVNRDFLEGALCTTQSRRAPRRAAGGSQGATVPIIRIDVMERGLVPPPPAPTLEEILLGSGIFAEVVKPVLFGRDGTAQVELVSRRACLINEQPVSLSCGAWDLTVLLAPNKYQPPEVFTLVLDQTHGGGGTFTGTLTQHVLLRFRELATGAQVELPWDLVVHGSGDWTFQPGTGGIEAAGPLNVDTDCDGKGDTALPGTTNLHLGWTASNYQPQIFCLTETTGGTQLCPRPPLFPAP